MRSTSLLAGILLATAACSYASSAEQNCEVIDDRAAAVLEKCGGQIRSFALKGAENRWFGQKDVHGRFYFACLDVPPEGQRGVYTSVGGRLEDLGAPCSDEVSITGSFVPASAWNASNKDKKAVWRVAKDSPLFSGLRGEPSTKGCPAFDIRVGPLSGRATCVSSEGAHGIIAVAGDRHIALVLLLSKANMGPRELQQKARLNLAQIFTVVRATGDASLLRWLK